MSGQNELGLNQREQHDRDDYRRNVGKNLAQPAFDKMQWHECGDGGQHAESHRDRDLASATDCCFDTAAVPTHVRIDVLTRHDGVVDEDAEHDNEPEGAHHVQADAKVMQDDERAEKADRNAEEYPDTDGRPQEQR